MSGKLNPRTDWAPPNAPPGCPRRRDDGSGPRSCAELACPNHLRQPSTRGRQPAAFRVRLATFNEDTCAVDVAERARAMSVELTMAEVGQLLGVSKQAVDQLERSAWAKVRAALRIRRP